VGRKKPVYKERDRVIIGTVFSTLKHVIIKIITMVKVGLELELELLEDMVDRVRVRLRVRVRNINTQAETKKKIILPVYAIALCVGQGLQHANTRSNQTSRRSEVHVI
jgi:hypothetical protein